MMRIATKVDTDSERWSTAVPADRGHLFQSMVIICWGAAALDETSYHSASYSG